MFKVQYSLNLELGFNFKSNSCVKKSLRNVRFWHTVDIVQTFQSYIRVQYMYHVLDVDHLRMLNIQTCIFLQVLGKFPATYLISQPEFSK